jgi:cysteine-rich repeat protein
MGRFLSVIFALILSPCLNACACSENLIEGDPDVHVDIDIDAVDDSFSESDSSEPDLPPPECGNGIIEAGEACDDGPGVDWDGCRNCEIIEFMVNEPHDGTDAEGRVAVNEDGRIAFVWGRSYNPSIDAESLVHGRILQPDGTWVGSEFRLSTREDCPGEDCLWAETEAEGGAVAFTQDGDLLAIWQHGLMDIPGIVQEIRARFFTQDGEPLGDDFMIMSEDWVDAMSFLDSRHIVLVEGYSDVFIHMFDEYGSPYLDPFLANTTTEWDQQRADVASTTAGQFAVVWVSWFQDLYGTGIYGRLFDGSGEPMTAEFAVNADVPYEQRSPVVAMSQNGRIVVAWESLQQDGDEEGVYARVFDISAIPVTGEFRVNQTTAGRQGDIDVATDMHGEFVIVWSSSSPAVNRDIMARRYAPDGTPLTDEFVVHTYLTNNQTDPRIAMTEDGRFVVVWSSEGQASGHQDVFAQRFDADGNPLGTLPW